VHCNHCHANHKGEACPCGGKVPTGELIILLEEAQLEINQENFYADLTKADCLELIVLMDAFEKRMKEKIAAECKIWTCELYSQEFLQSLIPKRR
jgi:hypothetical protein